MKSPSTLLLALLIAGCATAPRPPEPPALPAQFKSDPLWKRVAPPAGSPEAQVPEAWWQRFGDPVLNDLQDRLLVGNQNLAVALAQLASARAVLRASDAALLPTLSAGAGTTRSASSSAGKRSIANADSLTLNSAWELDLWGRLSLAVAQAGASYRASEAELAALRLSVQATLTQSYFALRTSEAQIELLKRTVQADQKALDLTQARYAGGVVAQSDVLQARTQLRSAQAQLGEAELQRAQTEHALAVLLGKAPAEFELSRSASLPELPAIPALLPSTLLEQRPDIAAARARQAAAYAQIGVADAAVFPSLSLSASGGYKGPGWSDLVSAPNLLWSLGAAVTAPLLDGGQRQLVRDQARAAADQSTANYRQVVLTALQEVEDNLVALAELGEELALQSDAMAAARRNLELVTAQYRAGTVSFLNVSAAQTAALSAESAVLNLRNRQLAAANVLLKNLGGRWPGAKPGR